MCGFVGFVSKQKKDEKKKIIKNMADAIIHRGPDSDGYYYDDNIALGFRRLSIIDLKHLIQLMVSLFFLHLLYYYLFLLIAFL